MYEYFFGKEEPDSAYGSMTTLDDSYLPFLHGTLVVKVLEASELPDCDSSWWHSSKNVTDAYVKVELFPVGLKVAETKVVNNSLFPAWGEEFRILVCHNARSLKFTVLDKDMWNGDPIGWCEVSCEGLVDGEEVEQWYDLRVSEDEDVHGSIKIGLQFFSKDTSETSEILPCYFPVRDGNRVTLYQDADTPLLPIFQDVVNPDGSEYVPSRLWSDIYNGIMSAEKFVYIAGWSVNTNISLLRGEEDPDGSISKIGELLKTKAAEGVRVLVMIWNEKTSGGFFSNDGQMQTHDEETEEYFADSAVHVANVMRIREGGGTGMVENEMVETIFTHHQKCVILDTEIPDSHLRRTIAYVGGIDLTDGRYDTPEYPLFDYVATHNEDFYQNCTPGATYGSGPREPWHDIHARIEGPAAKDVLQNFIDRWTKQAEDKVGSLIDFPDDEFDLENAGEFQEHEGGEWSVQVLRSITSDSCHFDRDRQNTLTGKRGHLVDDSILRAYILHIRSAKRFIYIENQYFMGSAYAWKKERDTQTKHTVPREIVSKIIEKIRAGELFTCYVTIPMFPEGDPTSMASQEILYWQRCTMESMYWRIGNTLRDCGSDAHPTDYLVFFCLGKREILEEVPEDLEEPDPDTPAGLVRQSLRHPIYVHSKLMIVDDEYIIVGSANINQRSMAGTRDSELAIGAFQPQHLAEDNDGQPRGDIHSFRMALWSAHLGGHDSAYQDPASPECVSRVREVTREYQEVYIAANMESQCMVHLLPYPIAVADDGAVEDEAGWDLFPDTQAPVQGKKSGVFPGNVTT